MHDANMIDIGINTCKLLAMRKTEKHYQMAYNCLYQSISDEKQIKNRACLIRIYTNATLNKELHQYITLNAFCFIGKIIIPTKRINLGCRLNLKIKGKQLKGDILFVVFTLIHAMHCVYNSKPEILKTNRWISDNASLL